MNLVGMTKDYAGGTVTFQPDLAQNIAEGDANLLALLEEADAYVAREGLDFPQEPDAKVMPDDPACVTDPILELDLSKSGINTVIWATGYRQDFSWLNVDTFNDSGVPKHHQGVSDVPGVYFLGLPWLSMRGSSFIWGVWVDAERIAKHIASRGTADG